MVPNAILLIFQLWMHWLLEGIQSLSSWLHFSLTRLTDQIKTRTKQLVYKREKTLDVNYYKACCIWGVEY